VIRIQRTGVKPPRLLRVGRVRETLDRMQQTTDARTTTWLESDLRRDVAQLKAYRDAKRPYAGMARQVIDRFLKEIGQ
jgi:hypothetical protein